MSRVISDKDIENLVPQYLRIISSEQVFQSTLFSSKNVGGLCMQTVRDELLANLHVRNAERKVNILYTTRSVFST